MRHHYLVPTGFHFTQVSTLREAKQLARQNGEGSQWFEKFERNGSKTRYLFNGRKWSRYRTN